MLSTLKRTITKSTLNTVEGTTYLCALCQHIAPGARVASTDWDLARKKIREVQDREWA